MRSIFLLTLFTLGLVSPVVYGENLPGNSLYQLSGKWVDQDGKELELKDLRGRPVLLGLVYLTCQYSCPTIISRIEMLSAKLSPKAKERTRILLVSFDPVRDTPKKMKEYGIKRKLDPNHWHFITSANETKIRELAATLNFKYQKIENGDYSHSFMIALLDDKGVLQGRVDATDQELGSLAAKLNKMIAGEKK